MADVEDLRWTGPQKGSVELAERIGAPVGLTDSSAIAPH